MKPVILLLVCLTVVCQGRVLQAPKEAIDIPVEIVKEPEPQALPLVKSEEKLLETSKPEAREPHRFPDEPETKPEIKEEIKLETKPEVKEEPKPELKQELKEDPKPELKEEPKPELKEEPKPELKPEGRKEAELEPKPEPAQPEPVKETETKLEPETQPQPEAPSVPYLKSLPAVEAAPVVPEVVAPVVVAVVDQEPVEDAVQPHVRQATQATPTQTTTQQNFVQQLIQNSPIGQFLSQFNGQPQQGQAGQQVAADQPAPAPAVPTVPGFLQPAVTTAQNAVQNVVNSTTQAFQGIQQFANNLGTQFQNTLSGLTGQAQVPTTARPPGPIQSFVNNVFGGGNNATPAAQPQQQGPFQGIINFLGGNRPTNAPAAIAPAAAQPEKTPDVDDKIETAQDIAEQPSVAENEVRASAEAIDDSFEEAVPSNEVIVVNDDATTLDIRDEAPASENNSVDSFEDAAAAAPAPVAAAAAADATAL